MKSEQPIVLCSLKPIQDLVAPILLNTLGDAGHLSGHQCFARKLPDNQMGYFILRLFRVECDQQSNERIIQCVANAI